MKIALIGPVYPYRGGIAHYTTALASALRKAGHDIRVYSFSRQYPKLLYPGKSDKDPSQSIQRIEAIFSIDTLNPISWFRTTNLIRQYQPDLVILQWWTTFMAPALGVICYLSKNIGLYTIFLIHNVYPHETRWFDRLLTYLALKNGMSFIVQSRNEKEKLLKLLPDAQVYQHPHPIYEANTNQVLEKREAKTSLGINPDLPVALFFGIIRPYKGLKNALEAIYKLKTEGTLLQLIVAGEFWENIEVYNNMIVNLGISDLTRLENRYIPNEEVPIYFSAADVFIAPYLNATQSGAVKLAMGFGLPIIISNIIVDDIVKQYGKTITFNIESDNSIVSAFRQFLKCNDCITNVSIQKDHIYNTWASLVDYISNVKIMSKVIS